jgi:phenylpropionate dioxygenase-like ring-hydroxylating dioxygenase large terminal subunit
MDTPVVLFRDGDGKARALVDRCPHRNAPLSLGRVNADGNLECGYHGWRFDGAGECAAVPGLLTGEANASARTAEHFATHESDGFVWIWGEANADPGGQRPFELPALEPNMVEVVFDYDLDCTMHAAIENALDVPHTAFLHRGIFRGGSKAPTKPITAERHDLEGGVEVQYLGEPVGMGPIQLGKKTNLTFDHWDRFFLPSVAQVEYRVDGWLRITNSILHLPMSAFRTRAWFVVRFWTKAPPSVVKPIVLARGKQILKQDAFMLKAQTENTKQFGGERYTSTDLDLLGNAIWRLLRLAEKGEVVDVDLPPRQVSFRV